MNDIAIKELEYLHRQYKKMPDGKPCAEAIRHAIKRADELQIREWQLRCRYDLIHQYQLYGDEGEMLPILSEFISLFEEQPIETFVEDYLYTLYCALGQWECFPLPLEDLKKLYQHFYQACKRYHANLSTYYEENYYQSWREGKKEEALLYRKKALEESKSNRYRIEFTSCAACKQSHKVGYALDDKDWDRAIRMAQPILNGKLKCRQHPQSTVSKLAISALDWGDWENAKKYAEMLEYLPKEEYDSPLWELLRYYAFSDLKKGVEVFCESFSDIWKAYDQIEQMGFYEEAYVLFTQYARKHKNIVLELPKDFPLYQEDGSYQPKALAEWFYEKMFEIAKCFDERNGYPHYEEGIWEAIEGMKKLEQEVG